MKIPSFLNQWYDGFALLLDVSCVFRSTRWIYQQSTQLEEPTCCTHAHAHGVSDIQADLRVPHVPLEHPLVSVASLRMSSLRAGCADTGNR